MQRDSGFADNNACFNHSNSIAFNYDYPQQNSHIEEGVTGPLSLHLHFTSRRIFIGPTPVNWNYKKKSIWFSKSDQCHQEKRPGKRRQRTFIVEPGTIGPSNMSSLDFNILEKQQQRKGEREGDYNEREREINEEREYEQNYKRFFEDQDRFVSEPMELIPSDNTQENENFENEIFHTPTEFLSSVPISPPPLTTTDNYLTASHNHSSTSRNYSTTTSSSPKHYFTAMSHNYSDSNPFDKGKQSIQHSKLSPPIITEIPSEEEGSDNDDTELILSRNIVESPISSISDEISTINSDRNSISNSVENSDNTNSDRNSVANSDQNLILEPFKKSNKSKYEPRTVIKEDRMLVKFERNPHPGMSISNHCSRHQCQSSEWKEYIVKLKPERIEFYKGKKIRVKKFIFSSKTRFTSYSTLDFTLILTNPTEDGKKVIIIRPGTNSLSVEWYRILKGLFSFKKIPKMCEVNVPDIDVRIQIPLIDEEQANKLTAKEVTKVVSNELMEVEGWEDVLKNNKNNDLRLCWKRYDRLEWIDWKKGEKNENRLLNCPQFIEGTHQLQIRFAQHYPSSVKLCDGSTMIEPPPIEGYLVRITNNKGKKKHSKRLYFTTHDYYLFFLKSFDASPPPPPPPPNNIASINEFHNNNKNNNNNNNNNNKNNNNNSRDSIYQHPIIYSIAPHLQGLYQNSDTFMKTNSKRIVKQIIHARGFIDLTQVVNIRPYTITNGNENNNNNNFDEDCHHHSHVENEIKGKVGLFELIMENGTTNILQAYSIETMNEWIKRLNELIKYWKARIADDIQIRVNMFNANKDNLEEDDEIASIRSDGLHEQFNNFKSYVNPIIWNWCILDGCRVLKKSGLLYHKSHFHGTFQNYYHILTCGYLIFFKLYQRSISGHSAKECYHKRKGIINLSNCYVYSGKLTEHDLIYTSSVRYNSIATGEHQLPRLYNDGMYCFDDDEECTFVIWEGKKKNVLKFDKKENDDNNDDDDDVGINGCVGGDHRGLLSVNVQKKIKLDHIGKSWVFRTRSRIEREEWVWAINVEIEKNLNNNNNQEN
ncbi:hypothetical protein Glove_299g29 [Diversispora epigaea]|uniref:PH domain-containing protein n=1 Tax=Diversispora epigaea TaxID=1348612 RepID=A0A397HXP1_9GLOM|nr:hypothetical protein Glove_299g29 [Diversispora epigaea]